MKNHFFTGYSYNYLDEQYELQYGTDANKMDEWKKIRSNNFSMMQVPNLKNGSKYYYQLRRLTAFHAIESEWSEVKEVIPNPGHQYGKISVQGFRQNAKELVMSLSGVKNAIGYQVICTSKNQRKYYVSNQSIADLIKITLDDATIVESVKIEPLLP